MIRLLSLSLVTPGRNEDLEIEIIARPSGVQLIKLSGPLTLRTLFEFQDAARHHAEHPLVVDTAAIPYMDSAGLGALIGVFASCSGSRHGALRDDWGERDTPLFRLD
jgi:hypothetical protein